MFGCRVVVNVWLQSRSLPARGRVGLEVHRCLCITDAGNVSISTDLLGVLGHAVRAATRLFRQLGRQGRFRAKRIGGGFRGGNLGHLGGEYKAKAFIGHLGSSSAK